MALNKLPSNASLKEAVAQSENINTEILTLRGKLETNLTSKGVEVVAGDKMSNLIDNVGNIELGKKWASGVTTGSLSVGATEVCFAINANLRFTPTLVYVLIENISFNHVYPYTDYNIYVSNLKETKIDRTSNTVFPLGIQVKNITNTSFDVCSYTKRGSATLKNFSWYAFE